MEKQDKELNLEQTDENILENTQNPTISNDEPRIDYAAEGLCILKTCIRARSAKLSRYI